MKIAIRYYTRGGNTKKLADAISKAVGADADDCAAAAEFAGKIISQGSERHGR